MRRGGRKRLQQPAAGGAQGQGRRGKHDLQGGDGAAQGKRAGAHARRLGAQGRRTDTHGGAGTQAGQGRTVLHFLMVMCSTGTARAARGWAERRRGRQGVAVLRQEMHRRAMTLLVAGGSTCSWMRRRRESRGTRKS
jgi:hypothetical protein